MKTFYKKIFSLIFFCFCINSAHIYAAVINIVDQDPSDEEDIVFENRSIIKCGPSPSETILTLFDVYILLAISNSVLETKVPLKTDWNALDEPPIISNKNLNDVSPDIVRIVFLCLNWEDLKVANLFPVSKQERHSVLSKIKQEISEDANSQAIQKKLSFFPDSYLDELVYIVLKAKYAQPVRGDLMTNPALKSIKFAWLF